MRFTRRKLLACSLAVGLVALVATANTPMTMIAGYVTHPQNHTASSSPRTAACWSEPVISVPFSIALPPVVEVPATTSRLIETLPTPATVEPPLAPLPATAPVVVLPQIDLVNPNAIPMPVVLPTAPLPAEPVKVDLPLQSRATPTEVAVATEYRKLIVDFSTCPLKFEMNAGESLLQVTCQTLDVRMPGEKGTTTTPLKAAGHVQFKAPGCVGSCDEMVIYTTTGEVVLHGSVKLLCRQGSVETEVTGTSVRFKLGAVSIPNLQTTGGTQTSAISR